MKDFLNDGSKWPLDEISKEERVKDLTRHLLLEITRAHWQNRNSISNS
jgi:hypothetical protein